jgi:hypothetical protein
MRRAASTDDNQTEIVKALRKIGCSVAVTSAVGDGFPDLVVGRIDINGDRKNWLVEVKDGNKPPSKRKLTPAQVDFHLAWKGQIAVVKSTVEALDLVLNIKGTE